MKQLRTRGSWLFREEFYSICSMHYIDRSDCSRCQTGEWINVWVHWISGLFYITSPKLWRYWINWGRKEVFRKNQMDELLELLK